MSLNSIPFVEINSRGKMKVTKIETVERVYDIPSNVIVDWVLSYYRCTKEKENECWEREQMIEWLTHETGDYYDILEMFFSQISDGQLENIIEHHGKMISKTQSNFDWDY